MATKVGAVYVDVNSNTSGMESGIVKAFKSLNEEASKAGDKVSSVGSRAAIAFSSIVLLKKAFSWGSDAVKTFAEVDSGLRELQTITGELIDTSKNVDDITSSYVSLGGQLDSLSDKYSKLRTDILPGVYEALSSGLNTSNVFGFADQIQKLATAGRSDFTATVTGVTQVINAYDDLSFSTKDVAQVSDEMFGVVNFGQVRMEELAKHLYKVAPAAAAVGVGLTDVNVALAMLTRSGTPIRVAATGLQYAITELGDSGKKAGAKLAELSGMNLQQFLASGRTIQDAFILIGEDAEKSGKTMFQAFNTREAAKSANILYSQASQYKDAFKVVSDSAGATAMAAAHMQMSTQAGLDNIKQNAETVRISLGANLSEDMVNVGNVVSTYTLPAIADLTSTMADGFSKSAGTLSVMAGDAVKFVNSLTKQLGLADMVTGLLSVLTVLKAIEHVPLGKSLKDRFNPAQLITYKKAADSVRLSQAALTAAELTSKNTRDALALSETKVAVAKANVGLMNMRMSASNGTLAATEADVASAVQLETAALRQNAIAKSSNAAASQELALAQRKHASVVDEAGSVASKASLAFGAIGAALAVGTLAWGVYSARRAKSKAAEEEHNRVIAATADLLRDQAGNIAFVTDATNKLTVKASNVEQFFKAYIDGSKEAQKASEGLANSGILGTSEQTSLTNLTSTLTRLRNERTDLLARGDALAGTSSTVERRNLYQRADTLKKSIGQIEEILSGYDDALGKNIKSVLGADTATSMFLKTLEGYTVNGKKVGDLIGSTGQKYKSYAEMVADADNVMLDAADGVIIPLSQAISGWGGAVEDAAKSEALLSEEANNVASSSIAAASALLESTGADAEKIKSAEKLREAISKVAKEFNNVSDALDALNSRAFDELSNSFDLEKTISSAKTMNTSTSTPQDVLDILKSGSKARNERVDYMRASGKSAAEIDAFISDYNTKLLAALGSNVNKLNKYIADHPELSLKLESLLDPSTDGIVNWVNSAIATATKAAADGNRSAAVLALRDEFAKLGVFDDTKQFDRVLASGSSVGAQAVGARISDVTSGKVIASLSELANIYKTLGINDVNSKSKKEIETEVRVLGDGLQKVLDLPKVAEAIDNRKLSINAIMNGMTTAEFETLGMTLKEMPKEIRIAITASMDARSKAEIANAIKAGRGTYNPDTGLWDTNAYGGIYTKQRYTSISEGNRPEAIIPLTDTSRAMYLMERSGLMNLAKATAGGGGTTYNIYDAHNPQAVASEIDWRERRRMIQSGLRR